jgi:muramoyltetrapeptide carboxypeptidase
MPEISKPLKIRIISPSGAINPAYLDGAYMLFQNKGFDVSEGKYAREVFGRYAGSDEQRLSDLQEALDDENLDVILCSRGGYGLCRIIEKVDFTGIKKHPKWVVGFSDISILHSALSLHGISSVHGVMAKHLSEFSADDFSSGELFNIFAGGKPVYHIPSQPENIAGNATGKLTGGNLAVLIGMRATPFDMQVENSILFLEEIGEKLYQIDRMFHNLRLSGVFDKINGLIIGHFTDCPDDLSMQQNLREIILDAVAGYNFPVCFGFPAGHEDVNYPLIMGAEVKLSVGPSESVIDFN